MGKKYYAVKKGREIGIYETWEACKEQVDGFKGAEYKSFSNLQDAEEYLNENSMVNESSKFIDGLIAYIDGSYDNNIKEYGSGIYITEGENEKLIKFKGNDERFLDNNNVAGELMACVYVMKYCLENNIKDVNICYDYEGIEKWANGTWQTKKTLTKLYKQFIDSVKDQININFVKVQAHSSDKGNNIADNLAKEALKGDHLLNLFENYNLEEEENKSFTIKFFEKQNMEKLKNFMNAKLNKYILYDQNCKSKINNLEVVNSLERCYDFYHERNSFVHANITRSGTKIISDKSIADKFILEGLSLIEDEYKKIKKYLTWLLYVRREKNEKL